MRGRKAARRRPGSRKGWRRERGRRARSAGSREGDAHRWEEPGPCPPSTGGQQGAGVASREHAGPRVSPQGLLRGGGPGQASRGGGLEKARMKRWGVRKRWGGERGGQGQVRKSRCEARTQGWEWREGRRRKGRWGARRLGRRRGKEGEEEEGGEGTGEEERERRREEEDGRKTRRKEERRERRVGRRRGRRGGGQGRAGDTRCREGAAA